MVERVVYSILDREKESSSVSGGDSLLVLVMNYLICLLMASKLS